MKSSKSILSIAALLATTIIIPVSGAVAGDTDDAALPSLVVSATRHEMPQSKVSSDITVITEEEISHMPVHDLSEALNYVTGLDLQRGGGPGTANTTSIQGSNPTHVKILIDNIPIELLSGGFPDLSMIPLENIKRVEIMKGSASSVWGSSLGGVVNIITKEPSDTITAEAGVSIGEENTNKYNAGLSGSKGGVGYFVSGSRLETDGFFENQDSLIDNFYGKLTKKIGSKLKVNALYSYTEVDRGLDIFTDEKNYEQRIGLGLDYSPKDEIDLSLSLYTRRLNDRFLENGAPENIFLSDKEDSTGLIFNSVWRHSKVGAFALGLEGSHGNLEFNDEDFDTDKKAVFANESYSIGKVSLNAGARYDEDSEFGSELSPSAGIVYEAAKKTYLRINAARGFSAPSILFPYIGTEPNKDLTAERAWTYQAGIESELIPFLWTKVVFYRADITDAIDLIFDDDPITGEPFLKTIRNIKELRRQGVEAELKTKEHKGIALSYGYAFNDVRDLDADEIVKGQARITHNIGVDYRGPYEMRGTLNGHYVWWNAEESANAKDKTFVWDAKVSKYLAKWKNVIGEVFVSVHNITDEDQFWNDFYPNPGRWVEGGVSLTFF